MVFIDDNNLQYVSNTLKNIALSNLCWGYSRMNIPVLYGIKNSIFLLLINGSKKYLIVIKMIDPYKIYVPI